MCIRDSVDIDLVSVSIRNSTIWGDTNPFADASISGSEYAAQAALEDGNVAAGDGYKAWIHTKREIQTVDNINHAEWNGSSWDSVTTDSALQVTTTASPMNISFDVGLANNPVGSLAITHYVSNGTMTIFGH